MSQARRRGFDVAVIGGGGAGLTAAWLAARHGHSTVLIEQAGMFGGQIATVGDLVDYPLPQPCSGPDFAASLVDRLRECGVEIVEGEAGAVAGADAGFTIEAGRDLIKARTIVAASGARLRKLGIDGEARFQGRGVSQCATCDGPLFRGLDVAVIGGGDSALQEALTLAHFCNMVHLVVRGDLKARQALVEAADGHPNIRFVWDCEADAILGEDAVEAVRLRDVRSGTLSDLRISGLFAYVGTAPNNGFLPDRVGLSATGHVLVDDRLQSSQAGLYAIGALRDGHGGALASAVGDAARAVASLASRLRE
jgi:thioredoxin reductase (NADPH)